MIKSILKNCLYTFLVFCLMGWVPFAFALEDSPQEIVRKYSMLDFQGVRLGLQDDTDIDQLVTWEVEPGWDSVFIVNSITPYSIKQVSDKEVLVEVKYQIIGILGGMEKGLDYEFYELVEFIVVRTENKWKIKSPKIQPHISVSSAMRQLEEILRIEGVKNKERIKKIEHTKEWLKDLANDWKPVGWGEPANPNK